MNVLGSTSTTPRSLTTARSATLFHFFNVTAQRRASSSTTSNPTLCRVPLYSMPGLPSPTIAFNVQSAICNSLLLLVFLFLFLGLFLLALLDDLGLRRRRGRRCRHRFGRRRDFLRLRHDHV